MATNTQTTIVFEVNESRQSPGDWVVFAVDHPSEGECYVATFDGSNAEALAREYAEWKNRHSAGMVGGLNN